MPRSVSPNHLSRVRAIALCLGAVLLAGCLGRGQYVPTLNYRVVPRPHVEKAPRTDKVLGIRALEPAQSLKSKIAFRESDYVVNYYPNAQWAEPPRDIVTRALADALVASGHFADVGDARDVPSNLVLTGELRSFEEVRLPEGPAAVVTVRLELRTVPGDALVWADTLSAQATLESTGLEALAAALSRATAEVVEKATSQIVQHTP